VVRHFPLLFGILCRRDEVVPFLRPAIAKLGKRPQQLGIGLLLVHLLQLAEIPLQLPFVGQRQDVVPLRLAFSLVGSLGIGLHSLVGHPGRLQGISCRGKLGLLGDDEGPEPGAQFHTSRRSSPSALYTQTMEIFPLFGYPFLLFRASYVNRHKLRIHSVKNKGFQPSGS